MRLVFVPLLLAALAAPAAADEPLVTTGELVMTKKGPAFRGQSRAADGAATASFDVKQKSYGATLHREHLVPGQDVRLGGGARELELTARSTAADGAAIESRWVLSGKARRNKTKRAVGEHRRNGRLVVREEVTVTRKRAVREVTTFGKRGATVRREELKRSKAKANAKAKRGRR